MISNYLKLAFRVLSRRKFFTFISLFGISFTLMILMIMISFLQAELGNDGPRKHTDRLVFLPLVKIEKQFFDTVMVYDTTYINEVMQVDSTSETKSKGRRMSMSEGNRTLFENHLPKVKTAENYSIYNGDVLYNVYVNNSKLQVNCVYADANFWEIFPFDFIEGRPFTHAEWENSSQVAVISVDMAEKYFGSTQNVINKEIELDAKTFKVIGLIETMVGTQAHFGGKMYIPYTNLAQNSSESYYHGGFNAALLVKEGLGLKDLKDDINNVVSQIPIKNPEEYNELTIVPFTSAERFSSQIYYDDDPGVSYTVIFTVIFSLLLLFILLPTLNLINLNVSRILDRSSEIGVRKAFGADNQSILFQFIFENIILTMLGGIIGLILALIGIKILNDSNVLEIITLTINWKFFIYSFIICIFFGILSGLLPAYKMSKLHIVNAIKQTQL